MGLERLRRSLEKHGQIHPIVVDKRTGLLLDGTKRVLACPNKELWKTEIETKDNEEAVQILLETMSPMLKGKERRAWVLQKYEVLTKLGVPRARAVELLAEYSGYSKMQIYRIVTNVTKEADSEQIFQKEPIKIESEIAAKVKQVPISDAWKEVEPNSVDLILTDPPYAYENLDVWTYLSAFAAYALKEGKLLITYSGKAFLPEIYRRLNQYLDYIWTIALIHSDNQRKCYHKLHIFERWKPILIFAKPPFTPNEYFTDLIIGTGREKELHPHAQAQGEAELIISQFTKENDLIVDPFCGSGTVLAAAQKLNRRFLGFDIDENSIRTTLMRLSY